MKKKTICWFLTFADTDTSVTLIYSRLHSLFVNEIVSDADVINAVCKQRAFILRETPRESFEVLLSIQSI